MNAFLNKIEDEKKRADSFKIVEIMTRLSGEEPKMWGDSIIGFGIYTYKYASGREGDWFVMGFSPRKQSITLYLMSGFGRMDDFLSRLGKHKTGKGCLYVKRLSDIDENVLREMMEFSRDRLLKK